MEKHYRVLTVLFDCVKRAAQHDKLHFREGLLGAPLPQLHLAASTNLQEDRIHYS